MPSGTEPSKGGNRSRSSRFHHRSHSDAHAHADSGAPETPRNFQHPLVTNQAPQLIASQHDLLELIQHLRAERTFAYDSEFIGELSYVPKLCLIQAATASRVALVDPLADLDLRPFWELVADASIEKVVHAGEQDVEPVFRAIDRPPANLFDTQIAGGFIGLGYPLALSKLVFAVLGLRLSKGLTFTHWDRRPLSDHQLRYASDDVRYLPAARHEMGKRLDALGHTQWAMEESAGLAEPSLHRFDPDSQFLKLRGAGALPPRNLAILRELTICRDECAQQDDVPPRTFLKDEILLDLARAPVDSVEGLARVRGLPRPAETAHGAQLIAAIARGKNLPADQLPEIRSHEPTPQEKFRADALCFTAQSLCAGRQIDPNLATSRQEIGELYRQASSDNVDPELRILRGWRRSAVGEHILGLLKEEVELSLRWKEEALVAGIKKL
ncbi:MAG: HRDC domain-containing protein [Planctomycetota bacterium]|nr:HRDC domain-containing protein [Planctomycetota bacterium]